MDPLRTSTCERTLVLNERFAARLDAAGRLAQRQRRAALVAGVEISGGAALALVRAAKQAVTAEA